MRHAQLTGTRIRVTRIDKGLRQAELARRCEISASYLNLIEHNRRKIGGALLNRLASELDVDPSTLSEGAEAALTLAMETAAARYPDLTVEAARTEDLADRFPGWARLVRAQHREIVRQERVIEALTDRLSHDPFLSASLHDVLSSVTAIRSASGILADDDNIAPEWRTRFHRNIFEDSRRLAQSAEQLVSYLDAGADVSRGISLPQEEVDAWLDQKSWRIAAVEADPDLDIAEFLAAEDGLGSPFARDIAFRFLSRYADDARRVPAPPLEEMVGRPEWDPATIAAEFGVGLPVVFRRLASLPDTAFGDGQARGLVGCDGSGTLTFRKALPGFDLPRYGAACPLWPVFQALQRPMQPIKRAIRTTGRDTYQFVAWAIAETSYPGGFGAPAVAEAWMLIELRRGAHQPDDVHDVGTSCRICAVRNCPARREPPLVAAAS